MVKFTEEDRAKLDRRERLVLKARHEGYTLAQLGEYFGLTRERVRQIETAAWRKLEVA